MRDLSHLNALRALEATLRWGSFTRAADELGVTAAAVGQQVRTLERYLGRTLVHRTAKGVEPLAETALAMPRLTDGMGALRDAMSVLKGPGHAHRLAVTAAPTLAEKWLAPRLPGFYAMSPQVDLRLDSTGAVADLRDGVFDLSLRHTGPAGDDYDDVALFPDYLIAVCAPEVAPRLRLGSREDIIGDVPLLHLESGHTSDPDWFGWPEWARRNGFDPARFDRGLRFSHSSVALRAAVDGHGLLLTGLILAQHDLAAGRLVAPLGADTVSQTAYRYRMVRLRQRPRSALHRRFEDWLLGEAAATVEQLKAYL